jgi:hypothetical protein
VLYARESGVPESVYNFVSQLDLNSNFAVVMVSLDEFICTYRVYILPAWQLTLDLGIAVSQ